ncbi:hypothetical protein Q9966_016350, partial [Columba livia]
FKMAEHIDEPCEGGIDGKSQAVSCLPHSEASSENGVAEDNVDSSVVDVLHQKYLNSSLYQSTKESTGESGAWTGKQAENCSNRNSSLGCGGAIFFGVKLDRSGIQNRPFPHFLTVLFCLLELDPCFFVTTNQCFSSVSAIELFIRDKKLFVHQYTSGYYRVSAYFLALMIGDLLPMRTAPAIIFSCISYWMIGYQAVAGRFFFFMLTLVLVSYTATAMSLAISAGMDVVAVANLLITICFVLMLIFSGLLVNLPTIMDWLNWLKYFSIPRYGLTALQVNEFRDLYFCGEKNPNVTASVGDAGSCPPSISGEMCSGEAYLCSQGIEPTNWAMWENIVALFCMTVIFLTIAYAKLRFMRKFT